MHSKQNREEERLDRLVNSHGGPWPMEHTGEACASESKHGPGHHTHTGRPTSLSELSASVRKGLGLVCCFLTAGSRHSGKLGDRGSRKAYGT